MIVTYVTVKPRQIQLVKLFNLKLSDNLRKPRNNLKENLKKHAIISKKKYKPRNNLGEGKAL